MTIGESERRALEWFAASRGGCAPAGKLAHGG
jgi:hypothetical protein